MKCRNTKVFIRVLPNVKNCWEDIKILQDRKRIYVRSLQSPCASDKRNCTTPYWQFETDGVFYNDSQIEIYNNITEDILERAIFYGNNAVILAFGQTGTGKSLTISGLSASYQDRGILPRLITDIFAQKEILKNTHTINVDISYVETNRSYLKDLFVLNGPYLDYTTIKDVRRNNVMTEDEAMKLLFIADGRRSIAVNNINSNSHIGNAVFTFYITTKSKRFQEKKLLSKIHIVDLVGADHYGYDTCHFKSAFDVGTGNLSKTQLEQFFNILSENIPEKTAVSQHLNILIYYLRDTLSTNNILRFVGHVRSNRNELIITLSMLRFAHILRGLKAHKLKINVFENEDNVTKQLEDELKLLKKELELNSMLNNESLKVNITQERIEHMESVAEAYLQNKTNELLVLNVCDASTVMKVFKNLYNKLQMERDQFAAVADRLRRIQDVDANTALTKRDGPTGYSNRSLTSKRVGSVKSHNSYETSSSYAKKAKSFKKSSPLGLSPADQRTEPTSSSGPVGVGAGGVTDGAKSSRTLHRSNSGGGTGMGTGMGTGTGTPTTSKRRSSQLSNMYTDVVDIAQATAVSTDNVQLPTSLPSFTEAWTTFLSSDSTNVALYDELQTCKDYARDANRLYIGQAKLLDEYRAMVETIQEDLLKVKLQSEIEHINEVRSGSGAGAGAQPQSQPQPPSHLESKCAELLKEAESQFLTQQEAVLKCQSELKLYVQQCNATKKDLNDRYNIYCKNSYKTVVPQLAELETKMDLDIMPKEDVGESHADVNDMENAYKTKTDELLNKFEQFKLLRNRECEKRRSLNLKNKKWIRSCKT